MMTRSYFGYSVYAFNEGRTLAMTPLEDIPIDTPQYIPDMVVSLSQGKTVKISANNLHLLAAAWRKYMSEK